VRANWVNVISVAAIVIVSTLLGTLVSWRAPGIDQNMRDWMIRARGPLPAPDNIAIVAIDESSIGRFGRFPWPRALSARAIDAIAAAQPKAIAVDVLFADPTSDTDDDILARSIQQAGNVVVAAQLVEPPTTGGPTSWLLPLPAIERGAAAVGHVNVSTEADGVARQILVQAADDQGRALRAMAVEIIRVGEGIPESSLTETSRSLMLGSRVIPVESIAPSVVIGSVPGAESSTQTLRASRMAIDYIGPPGSYRTYSFADVADGRIPPVQFRGKYVLVGATAASLGDRLTSPFVHQADTQPNQHGSLMPGVEVLANTLNTILRSRFYSETRDWLAFLCGVLAAALTMFLLAVAEGRHETVKQICALIAVIGAIVLAGYLAFTRFLVFPPLTLSLVSFASAGVLGFLRRSLVASSHLDRSIEDIKHAEESLNPMSLGSAAWSIARLADAEGVAIYTSNGGGSMDLAATHGLTILRKHSGDFAVPPYANHGQELLTIPIGGSECVGTLVIAHGPARKPSLETQRLCATIAGGAAEVLVPREESSRWWLPRGLTWKAKALGHLNSRILDRAKFGELAMRSIEDALIIAGVDGRITFSNRRAAAIFDTSEPALRGRDLLELLGESGQGSADAGRDLLARLIIDRAKIEREIAFRGARPRYFTLRMAAVCSGEDGRGAVRGIVASLSDVTRQHDLQQTKNDVMALVSHEMRTPLTAIQGMSELLAQFDLEPDRSREMSLAIHDEAKRLTHMINQYLDITRLESGATVLRRSVVRIEALVERTLLLLDPLATKRGIHLTRHLDSGAPPVLADADLLSRAISNLVSNAIKYSPPKTEVVVSARDAGSGVSIEVADQGYGIPEASVSRVFEKFYRVPRAQDVDVPGTGLGLTLVREIAELHGGSVAVRSDVGAGSVFTLWVPCLEDKR
jgi:signal transduction histidine kinase/CHASE2 domain-containing sensor protein